MIGWLAKPGKRNHEEHGLTSTPDSIKTVPYSWKEILTVVVCFLAAYLVLESFLWVALTHF